MTVKVVGGFLKVNKDLQNTTSETLRSNLSPTVYLYYVPTYVLIKINKKIYCCKRTASKEFFWAQAWSLRSEQVKVTVFYTGKKYWQFYNVVHPGIKFQTREYIVYIHLKWGGAELLTCVRNFVLWSPFTSWVKHCYVGKSIISRNRPLPVCLKLWRCLHSNCKSAAVQLHIKRRRCW
jgi:hypothetical protein